ncbi:MAG: matrixin family metalloprotease [Methanotrichaceae archaeon]
MFIKLSRWLSSIFLAVLLISFFAANSSGLSVSHSYNDGSGSISDSQNYHIDTSTSIKSTSIFEGGSMQQTIQANGNGQNSIGQQIKGNLYSTENTVSSSGSFGVSSSTGASSTAASTGQSVSTSGESTLGQSVSGEGYSLQNSVTSSGLLSHSGSISASADDGNVNQQLIGGGNVALTTNGIQGEDNTGQKASVEAGLIASDQSISSGQGVSSSQSTAISGEAGSLGSGALSSDKTMLVTGSFDGSGSLNADLNSGVADQASANGKVSVNGGTLIDDSTIQDVGKENTGLNMEGQTAAPDGSSTGSFSANVVNMKNADGKLAGAGVAAAQAQTGYKLWTASGSAGTLPMKWTQNNPQIQLTLNGNSVPSYLNKADVATAISSAASTWDNTVAQSLFAAGNIVTIDNNKPVIPADPKNSVGYNSRGWRSMSTNENPNGQTLAITYNWLGAPVNGYYSIKESDTAYNSAQKWSTTGSNYDVQSVSLHELGHTIGLDHVSDTNQIMNPYYTGSRSLGSGDTAGAQFLYGREYSIAGNVALQADANGKYVCAENAGQSPLIANRDWTQQWETFGLIDLGNNNIALQAVNGKYVCAEDAGQLPLIANRDAIGQWETFKLIDLGNNNIALQSAANGKYVCAENAGQSPLIANRDWTQQWETFGLKYI